VHMLEKSACGPSRNVLVLCLFLFVIQLSLIAQVMQGPTTIRTNEHHDLSPPLSIMAQNAPVSALTMREAEAWKRIPLPQGMSTPTQDPVLQQMVPTAQTPSVGLSFEGLGHGQYGFSVDSTPPDTNGVVGATQYVQWVNESFIVFNKATGAKVLGPVAGNTLWSGFGGGCQTNNDGDPVVQYDKLANRWVMSQFSVSSTPYLQCVAVSKTNDATGQWYRYSFQYSNFDDYPKMAVWPDAYYETFNMFSGNTFVGPDACAYDRNKMLVGQAATQVCFQLSASVGALLPSDLDGINPPPPGSPNYLLGYGTNSLILYKFHVDFLTPQNSTLTGPTVINVAAFTPLCAGDTCVSQPGTLQLLDSLGDRLMYRVAYRNFGSHESLAVSHSVAAGTKGGVRWYEIQNPSGTPVVAQQSTYAPSSTYRWMPSIAMDQAGNLAIGYSMSSTSPAVFPSIAYAGRLATDPVSTLQSETIVMNGHGVNDGPASRWGDYSAMTVDPVDDCTFWYTQEYYQTSNGSWNWNTRIANFKFPNCGLQVNLTPSSLTFGNQLVGTTSASQPATLTNNQSTALSGISIATSGDFAETDNCGTSLPANSSCMINVTFTPSTTGTQTGTLTVNDSAGTQTSRLTGTGIPPVSLTPSTLNFGLQKLNTTSGAKPARLTNNRSTSLTGISVSITGTNAGDFAQTNNCGTSIGAHSGCTINVTFAPSGYSARTATLKVTDSDGTQTSSLKGVVPPTTRITNPANGATLSGTVTLTATATDTLGISSIQIYIDGVLKASSTSSPLNYSWNTLTANNGSHTIYSKAADPSGNTGMSNTITVTVNNPQTQLINNGGFETGNLSYWTATGVSLPFVVTGHAHIGTYSAQLGASSGPEPNGDSSLYQTITIPSTATTATLTYWYWGATTDRIMYDWQEAQVQNSSGATLAQIMKVCTNARTWTQVTYDLTKYKGQTIRIYFNNHQDGYGDLTYMYVDDVSVLVR